MSHTITGYFRMSPAEIGADLIFVPKFTMGVSALQLAVWGKEHGYVLPSYVPTKHVKEKPADASA